MTTPKRPTLPSLSAPPPATAGRSPYDLLAAELARRARELPIEDLARLVAGEAPARRRRRHRRTSSGVRPIEAPPSVAPASSTLRDIVTRVMASSPGNPLTSSEIVARVLATPGHAYREPSIRSEISRQVSEGQAVRVGPKIGGVYRRVG